MNYQLLGPSCIVARTIKKGGLLLDHMNTLDGYLNGVASDSRTGVDDVIVVEEEFSDVSRYPLWSKVVVVFWIDLDCLRVELLVGEELLVFSWWD